MDWCGGVRLGLAVTVALAALTLGAVWRVNIPVARNEAPTNILGVWRSLPPPLRWLLASDIFIRACEGLVDVFIVLYVTNVIGLSAPQFGALIAVQAATSIVSYLPVAVVADRLGRKPFVIATFVAFAAFPVAVVLAHDFVTLLVAFVVGGLREIGEPARKAMIVDLVSPPVRCPLDRTLLPRPLCGRRAGGIHRRDSLEHRTQPSILDGERDRPHGRGALRRHG